jgi:hypothetical protein
MARHVRTPIAGILIAIATSGAAASEATAQDRSLVLNNQLQLGDVISGVTLNVETTTAHVTVSNEATGNTVSGIVQGGAVDFRNVQQMNGNVRAITTPSSWAGEIGGVVNANTQASGNSATAGAYGSEIALDSDQRTGAVQIEAATSLTGGSARLLEGAFVHAGANGNQMTLGGESTRITGAVRQSNDATIRASNLAETRYIPAPAVFSTQAVGNATLSNATGASSYRLDVGQRSTGTDIVADTSANAGNAWDLSGRASATANHAVLHNAGGSLVARTQQENLSRVQSEAVVTSFDFGVARSAAQGAGNVVSVANQDLYLELDNSQFNTGGVEVTASFAGTNGYDAYVSADAVGNSVTGFACAQCQGTMTIANDQTNSGSVSASANTNVFGQGRAVITGSNAVGNAASFYVSQPSTGH